MFALQLLKKSLLSTAIYSIYLILYTFYLFYEYRAVSSSDQHLELFLKIMPQLAIANVIGYAMYALVGWMNFKKAKKFTESLWINAFTAAMVTGIILVFDFLMGAFVENYFVIITGFQVTDNLMAFVLLMFLRVVLLVTLFGMFVLFSFFASLILKKISAKAAE